MVLPSPALIAASSLASQFAHGTFAIFGSASRTLWRIRRTSLFAASSSVSVRSDAFGALLADLEHRALDVGVDQALLLLVGPVLDVLDVLGRVLRRLLGLELEARRVALEVLLAADRDLDARDVRLEHAGVALVRLRRVVELLERRGRVLVLLLGTLNSSSSFLVAAVAALMSSAVFDLSLVSLTSVDLRGLERLLVLLELLVGGVGVGLRLAVGFLALRRPRP